MKVGLLTHPLRDNYGGIMQAVALHSTLEELGCSVTLLRKEPFRPLWKKMIISTLERIPFQNIRRYRSGYINHGLHRKFIEDSIPKHSPVMMRTRDLKRFAQQSDFDAFVVG